MKFKFTLAFVCSLMLMNGMIAQSLIWGGPGDPNSEFDGGLNDWTTVGISSAVADSAANSLWIWDADGVADMGAFWGTQNPITSPSVANGVALFDSDFLDNAGTGLDGLGTGSSPSPHTGELISPMIDLTNEPSVVVSFYQKYRNFSSSCFVGVSNDGGATFTDFQVNGDVDGSIDNQENVNISAVAGGQDSVVIKFKFVGDYYYWMIDDVALITLPATELEVVDDDSSPFYTPASAIAPACSFEQDTFFFSTIIRNNGAETMTNVVYKAEVSNFDSGEVLFADSIILDEFPALSDSVVGLENTYAPEGLEEGGYQITHSVYSLDFPDDFDMTNNAAAHFFVVNNMLFGKEWSGSYSYGYRNGTDFYAVGAIYDFGDNCMENYTVGGIQYAAFVGSGDPNPLAGRPVQFWIWKMTDDFDFSTNYEEDILSVSNPSMEFQAFSLDEIAEEDENADIITSDAQFLNLDGEETMVMFEPGESYAIFTHWGTEGSAAPVHAYASEQISNGDLLFVGGDQWYTGLQGSSPILRLILELYSSVDEKPLPAEAFRLYPNPAKDLVNLEVNLENSSKATITIANISGQVISYQNHNNISNETITINVSDYPSGSYLARIATEEGTKTLKFVVD